MARIRTIKPEFWTDEKIVMLSSTAKCLFIGLWNFCDDEGRMEFSLLRTKLQILPLDPSDLSAEIGELQKLILISLYEVDGKAYLQVKNFDKHQKIDKRSRSKLPPPPLISSESPRTPPNPPDGMEEEGEKEGKGKEEDGFAFTGRIIRLNHRDFDSWHKAYHAIPDLRAELTAIDDKLSDTDKSGWFKKVSGWLRSKHERLTKQAQATAGMAWKDLPANRMPSPAGG